MVLDDARTNGDRVSETTPLLRDNAVAENGNATGRDAIATQEPSLKELLLQLGCVWVGVFFAALGEYQRNPVGRLGHLSLTILGLQTVQSSRRYRGPSPSTSTPAHSCHGFLLRIWSRTRLVSLSAEN